MTPISVGVSALRIDSSNSLNNRVHWRARAKKNKAVAAAVRLALLGKTGEARAHLAAGGRCAVTITRRAPRPMDSDNNTSALKAVRDAVAELLGVDDGDPRWRWQTAQTKGDWAVLIEIAPISPDVSVRATEAIKGAWAELQREGLTREAWLNVLRSHLEDEIDHLKVAHGKSPVHEANAILRELGLPGSVDLGRKP